MLIRTREEGAATTSNNRLRRASRFITSPVAAEPSSTTATSATPGRSTGGSASSKDRAAKRETAAATSYGNVLHSDRRAIVHTEAERRGVLHMSRFADYGVDVWILVPRSQVVDAQKTR